jgi:3D (Asp-Asp-Asp) domain-containing protein
MRLPLLLLLGCALALGACSSPARKLPKYEKPIARTRFQSVRTTAYTHSESDHLVYGRKSALGTTLRSGAMNSAAADWARWPAGTVFRICSTGELYQVDDYGWALTGRNTIDLYKPSRAAMNAWGLRQERIEVLRWGDAWASYKKMKPAAKYAHVAQMLRDIKRFHSGGSPGQPPASQAEPPTVALVRAVEQ